MRPTTRPWSRRGFLGASAVAPAASRARAPAARSASGARGGAAPASPGRLRKVRDFDILRSAAHYLGPGPSAVRFPDGRILLGLRRAVATARTHTNIDTENCVIASADGGRSWSEPEAIDYGGVHNVNLTLLGDGTVLYATPVMEAITEPMRARASVHPRSGTRLGRYGLVYEARQLGIPSMMTGVAIRRSTDQGRTWSPRFWVSPIAGTPPLLPGFPSPANLRSPVIQLRSGRLALPVYSYPDPWRVVLMTSDNGGMTWSTAGEIAGPSDPLELPRGALVHGMVAYNETFVHETPSGRLVAFIRIHAGITDQQREEWGGATNPAGFLVTSESSDGGKTWLPPVRRRLWGYPCWAIGMPSGRVLLAYGYRQEPYGIRARLLDAECRRIDEAEELVVRDDGGMRDLGYPQGLRMPDGRVLLVYYFNSKAEEARQVYLAASILEEV